jgi:hypothetical protein
LGVGAQASEDDQRLSRQEARGLEQDARGLGRVPFLEGRAAQVHGRPAEVDELDELVLGGVAQAVAVDVEVWGDGRQDLVDDEVALARRERLAAGVGERGGLVGLVEALLRGDAAAPQASLRVGAVGGAEASGGFEGLAGGERGQGSEEEQREEVGSVHGQASLGAKGRARACGHKRL